MFTSASELAITYHSLRHYADERRVLDARPSDGSRMTSKL